MDTFLMKSYKDYLVQAMNDLSSKKNTLFLGQSVNFSGNAIFNTLEKIKDKKKIELPVFEETQMGISIGMALEGFVPITCFPRFDFLLLAVNQLVNHLDKIEYLTSRNDIKVIIRTSIGSKRPLDGGPQHTQNHTSAFRKLLKNIKVINLESKNQILTSYRRAYREKGSFLMIEDGDSYNK